MALIGVIISNIVFFFINEEQTALLLQMLEYLTTWDTFALNFMIFTIGGILQSCVIVVILCRHGNHEMAFGHIMGFIIFHVCTVPGLMFYQSCVHQNIDNLIVSKLSFIRNVLKFHFSDPNFRHNRNWDLLYDYIPNNLDRNHINDKLPIKKVPCFYSYNFLHNFEHVYSIL